MEQIGRYRILEKLGHGGMGVVYKAFDPQIERNVAIKVISTQRVDDPELRDRFFREARAAGLLSHPNIVVVYDLGEHEAQPYIAMEFVDGVTLDAVMRSGEPFPMSRRIGLMLDVCEGLGYAHDRGVIHRDVKPGNIMVSRAGSAKILDFGLARLVSSDLTRSNLMLGTMSYMAPEQLRSEAIDHRIDIFAIGVVMYELFSGRRPFQSDSAASAIYNVLEEEPVPVHECNPHAPPELGPIVGRALAKDREQRYSSMHELAQDLASIPVTPEQDAPVPVSPLPGTASEFEPTMLPPTLLPAASRRTTPTPRARTPARGTRTLSGRAPGSAPPVPTPHAGPPGAATPSSADGARHRPSALGKGTWLAIAAAVVLVAAVAAGILLRPTEGTQPSGDRATATRVDTAADQQRARSHVARGREAFRAADYKTALDEAEAALRVLPDDREGRRLLEEVRRVRSTIDSGTREARRLSEAGRYEEAARAASQVLALAPNDADAQAVLKQASSHAGREMASDAMRQLTRARAQADTDAARQHAREAFAAAQRAEAQARRRYEAGDFAAATNGFYETSSLYRAAAAEARRQVQLKESREEEAARARELEQRLTSARDAFDRRRAEAQEVGAPQRAVALFNSAQEQAARAAELGRDETAVREYEVAERRMDEARRLAIDAAARERAAAVAPAPPPVERPAPAAAPTATAPPRVDPNPEEAIQNVLRQYAAALESRNLEALKRIWPSLRGEQEQAIRDDFQNARDISVSIESPRIQAQQDAATVTCVRRYQLHTRDGRRQQAETQTTINMRLSGSSWIIDTIRHEQR